jgi:hypothetical protein
VRSNIMLRGEGLHEFPLGHRLGGRKWLGHW